MRKEVNVQQQRGGSDGWIRWLISLWPVLASLVGAGLWIQSEVKVLRIKVDDMQERTVHYREDFRQHEALTGHIRIDEKVEQLTRRVEALERK